MNKKEYKLNRKRVKLIMGIDPSDKRFNCHHIVGRSDYSRNKKFWDASVPSGHFNVDGVGNLFPLMVREHERLHEKINLTNPPVRRKKKRKIRRRKRRRR